MKSKMIIEYRDYSEYVRVWNEDLSSYGRFKEFSRLTFVAFKHVAQCLDIEVIQLGENEDSSWD